MMLVIIAIKINVVVDISYSSRNIKSSGNSDITNISFCNSSGSSNFSCGKIVTVFI